MEINFSELNWFDYVVFTTVFLSTLLAFFRGFIKAVFSLATWLGASAATAAAYPFVKDMLQGSIENEKKLIAVAAIGTFIVLFIFIAIISAQIQALFRGIQGGAIDRTLGVAFGFARGVLIVCMVFYSVHITANMLKLGDEKKPGPEWFSKAATYNLMKLSTDALLTTLPKDVPEKLIAQVDSMKTEITEAMGEPGSADNNLPRTLNSEEKDIMKSVIRGLPKDQLKIVAERYQATAAKGSDIEKMQIYREILRMYKEAENAGKVDAKSAVAATKLKTLDDALNGKKGDVGAELSGDQGTGYKDMNIKQMDRLVGNVQ